jgi:hypothetical protein
MHLRKEIVKTTFRIFGFVFAFIIPEKLFGCILRVSLLFGSFAEYFEFFAKINRCSVCDVICIRHHAIVWKSRFIINAVAAAVQRGMTDIARGTKSDFSCKVQGRSAIPTVHFLTFSRSLPST